VEKARALFRAPPVTRFAPSPTGYLHLGHVVNAIYTWGVARALDGRVILRIEDHDRIRSRPEFVEALLEDLDWLGFTCDEGRHPLLRQSDRDGIYTEALETRGTGAASTRATARVRRSGANGMPADAVAARCRNAPASDFACRSIPVRCTRIDLMRGAIEQVPAEQCGDVLIKDRDGNWTYQFAATVDDWRQGITLVIRGADLESSTGRQVVLAGMLGRREPAIFLHHPLIVTRAGKN
jgi:glutamyl-tRNA synthetase/glutamyl-Q tRNA(Asp) synthetase